MLGTLGLNSTYDMKVKHLLIHLQNPFKNPDFITMP